MNRRAMFKPLVQSLALALAALLCACGGSTTEPPPLAGARIGGPFTLVDNDGRAVRWSDFAGQYRIVYFGYTYCPDVCPLDMQATMRGLADYAKQHPALAKQIKAVFISIDPQRDTPKVVGQFAAAISPNLIGLTGSPEQVATAAKAFGTYYARGPATPGGGYLMDHSRTTYLMGRNGEPIAMLPADQGPQAVAAELTKWVR